MWHCSAQTPRASLACCLSDRLLLSECWHVAATAIFRQRRQAPDCRLGALPGHRPLRCVAMPRPRIEIAKLLVFHLIKLDIELDRVLVRIAVIGRNIMAGTVAQRAPRNSDLLH